MIAINKDLIGKKILLRPFAGIIQNVQYPEDFSSNSLQPLSGYCFIDIKFDVPYMNDFNEIVVGKILCLKVDELTDIIQLIN